MRPTNINEQRAKHGLRARVPVEWRTADGTSTVWLEFDAPFEPDVPFEIANRELKEKLAKIRRKKFRIVNQEG